MTTSDDRQGAITKATGDARFALRRAAVALAEASGAEIEVNPVFPGAASTRREAEPLAGIRAARTLRSLAAGVEHDYLRSARSSGVTWLQIGQALGLDQGDDAAEGYDLGVAAYEHAVGKRDLWSSVTFGFTCGSCQEVISDRGPFEACVADCEHDHADDCPRFTAELRAYEAEWADE